MRILLAEDQKDLNKIINKRLSVEGYSVDSCFDGEEVSDFTAAASYDCIIMDIMMPKKDGLTVLREMRQRGDSTPVLLLTARILFKIKSPASIWEPTTIWSSLSPLKNLSQESEL